MTDSLTEQSSIIADHNVSIRELSLITIREKPIPLSRGIAETDVSIQVLHSLKKQIIAFHLMVKSMSSIVDFTPKSIKLYRYKQLIRDFPNVFSYLTRKSCRVYFEQVIDFYVHHFDKLNLKLVKNLQKIFDLIKIVHTMTNLDKVVGKVNYDKIKEIATDPEIGQYLYFYRIHDYDLYSGSFGRNITEVYNSLLSF